MFKKTLASWLWILIPGQNSSSPRTVQIFCQGAHTNFVKVSIFLRIHWLGWVISLGCSRLMSTFSTQWLQCLILAVSAVFFASKRHCRTRVMVAGSLSGNPRSMMPLTNPYWDDCAGSKGTAKSWIKLFAVCDLHPSKKVHWEVLAIGF
jgi:hypothetical protein